MSTRVGRRGRIGGIGGIVGMGCLGDSKEDGRVLWVGSNCEQFIDFSRLSDCFCIEKT